MRFCLDFSNQSCNFWVEGCVDPLFGHTQLRLRTLTHTMRMQIRMDVIRCAVVSLKWNLNKVMISDQP